METLSYVQETESLVLRAPTKEGERCIRAAYEALHLSHTSREVSAKARQLMIARVACGEARRTVPELPDA